MTRLKPTPFDIDNIEWSYSDIPQPYFYAPVNIRRDIWLCIEPHKKLENTCNMELMSVKSKKLTIKRKNINIYKIKETIKELIAQYIRENTTTYNKNMKTLAQELTLTDSSKNTIKNLNHNIS